MAQLDEARHGTTRDGAAGPILRAQLAIEPHQDSMCGVIDAGTEAKAVTHHLKTDADADSDLDCGECHTEISYTDDRNRAYLKSAVTTRCICPVFEEHDCIPKIKAVRSRSIIVTLTIPHREILQDIIADLRTVGATVSVDWLVRGSDTESTAEIDVSTITDKQQEAMETAKELGYYETPRRADLGDVATDLGISESAASQRLNAAETKLVQAFLEE